MKTVTMVQELRSWRTDLRAVGRRVVLVPTMGALHEGHLRLIDAAAAKADEVVVSVFVNPLQFAPTDDLERYPRHLERDAALAAQHGASLLFTPSVAAMYPTADFTTVHPGPGAIRWEAASRPGHFVGVLTVLAKLFNLVQPDAAVFGQKDIQQVTLVRQMVADLNIPVGVVMVPTARDPDGLALSSRNAYLTAAERSAAAAIPASLRAVSAVWQRGERSAERLAGIVAQLIGTEPTLVPEYIAVVEPTAMEPVREAAPGSIVAIAVRAGTTRLIDNMILGEDAI